MIGHQILLQSNDSTSRVLPISKEGNQYRIEFESEFEFIPEDLVATINHVLLASKMETGYIAEVENCETKDIVYSLKMDELEQTDIVPCKGRVQPKDCYNLLITLLNVSGIQSDAEALVPGAIEESNNNTRIYISLFLLLALISSFVFFWWKKKNSAIVDPNLIALGEYSFDKRNTELIKGKERIELSAKEADLLLLLYNSANTTVERETILNRVWGNDGDYVGRTMDVFISKLRKKLEADTSVKIVNIRGIGYKLVMDV
ncbi:MAG: winged helix-turn-helix transcriptional regulator [Bacteroidia bacterium]|nr:winged helix-turn-helix domain-containing protein [Bacteroidia bacterium]NNM15143.1 winged helix-turn-helix transcriptional regulator [Bacteroidia bacterium]